MSSSQYWLRLLPVIGLLQTCVCSRIYRKDSIKVPVNYEDTESARYDTEEIEYDIVDQKLRMWGEEDHVVRLSQSKVTPGSDREGVNPRFTKISNRTVIPDQSELDQVDEEALKRGHEEITVDKDDEILTEVIEDDAPPSSLPLSIKSKPTVLPSMSVSNATKHRNLSNKELQNTQPTINKDKSGYFFGKSKNKSPNTTLTSGEQGQNVAEHSTGNANVLHQNNSLQTAQIIGDSSSTSQRSTNFSLPSISGETNKIDSIGQKFENSSQNTSSFHDESATSQVQLSEFNTTKANAINNSLSQGSSNLMPSTSTQNSYTETYNESSSFGNKPFGKTAIKDNVSNLTDLQNIETVKSNDSSKNTNTLSADLTKTVNSTSNNIFLKGVENISKMKKSIDNNSTDATSIIVPEQSQNRVKESSDIGRARVFNTNATRTLVSTGNLTSERDKTKKKTVDRLEQKMDVLLRSHRDWAKEPQGQQEKKNVSLHADNGSRSFLPTNVRRMNIIHHHASTSAPRKQKKASRKLKSFLTAVKQMFKEPETAQDILAWEAWGPCSRTCGEGAVRIRQRKCAGLVARDFDVACPEPREQRQMCPVVSCLSKHDKKSSQEFPKTTEMANNVSHRTVAYYKNVDEASGKQADSLRAPASSAVNKFIGTENNLNQDSDDVSTTSRLNTEDQTDDDAVSPTEDSEGTTEGYDESSVQEYQSNLASVQTANQKRYLYTVWGTWSACTRTCGQRTYAFRKRYCINAVTGEIKRHCQKPTILAKKCVLTPCPVDGGLSDWSKWSSCSDSCGIMERHRSCTNPKPAFGGRECFKLPVQMRLCGTCTEDKVVAVQKLPSYSPKALCGFDPCQRVGCLEDKGAICVTDFECNPTFFDDKGNVLKGCRDSTQLFLRPLAQKKCSFNPCSFTKCDAHGAKCLVDTKCRPFFVNEMGKRVNCKGSNVLQISSELICGFNPCKITTCTVDPEAKCVTDYRCNPIFINAAGQRISGCTEDEVEEAERLSTERPTAARQSTENPSARDVTPFQHHNPYRLHSLQKFREELSVKKSIESNLHETKEKLKDIKLLEDIFTRRFHHNENLDSENKTNSGDIKNGHPDESGYHLNTSSNDLGKETRKASSIKLLEHILQHHLHRGKSLNSTNSILTKQSEKFHDKIESKSENSGIKLLEHILQVHLHPSKSLDSTNSTLSEQSEKSRDKTKGKSENSGIKLLEHILQAHLHRSKSLDSKKSMLSEKSEKFQDKTDDKSEIDFQNFRHDNDSENGSKALVENGNKKSANKITGFNLLNSDNGITSDDGIKLKTLHQNKDETTDIVDSPSIASNSLDSPKSHEISKINQVLDKPLEFTNKNSVDPSEKLFQSKTLTDKIMETDSNAKVSLTTQRKSESKSLEKERGKNLADVDRFILDELYKKKQMEDSGTTSLGLSGANHAQGKVTSNAVGVKGYMGENNVNSVVKNNEGNSSGYNNDNNNNNNDNNNNNNWNNGSNDSNSNNDISNGSGNNNNISRLNDNNNNNNDNNNKNLSSSAVSNQDFNNSTLLNTHENILKNSPTSISGTMNKMKGTNEIINNHLTTTTTTISTANNNSSNNNSNNNNNGNNNSSNNNNGNSNVISYNNNNNNRINLNPDYNKNVLNTKINLKPSKSLPTIISTTPKSNPPPQNNTIHYNLGLAKIASTKNENENKPLDTKLRIHSRPQMPKASSDKQLGDTKNDNIKGKVMPWEEYIANMKNMNLEGSVLFDDEKKVSHSKPQFDHNQSDNYDSSVVDVKLKSGKVKLVDGSKMVPGHVAVGAESGKPGIGGQVIHSSDPNLEIPPYDEEVTSSAFEKEQSENPEGIPSKAELNRILNSVSDSQLASGNQESNTLQGNSQDQHADYVLPQKSRHEHKYPLASSARPLLSPAQQVNLVTSKQVNQVTNKPINQVTDIPVHQVTNKPVNQVINKPVNQVINKPVNQVTDIPVNQVTDMPVNQVTNKPVNQVTDSPSQNDLINKLVLKAVQQELAKLKLDGLLKDSLKNTTPMARQGSDETAKIFTQKPNPGYLGVTRKPSDNHAYLGLSKGYHGLDLKVHGQPGGKELSSTPKPFHFNAISTNVPIFQDEKGSHSYNEQASDTDSQQGGVGSGQQGSEPDKNNDLENEAESLREIDEILKSPYTGNEIEKTTARPGQTTNTPEENNNHKIVESSNEYTVTLAPMKEGGTENDEEDQRISEVNDEDREEQKEPANKESYSPALMDEIKELGLHEYYIKDGFQTPHVPKHRKVADGQVRQVLKSHHLEGGSDDYDRHKNHPVRYKKKFHLAQVEMLPKTYAGHSALRQHNADGDEIERVPNNYREADGVARSHTSQHGVGSLTKYLEHLRQYVNGMDGDLLDSGLKGKHRNEATQEDLGNAIILNAKDDGNSENGIDDSENSIEDSKTPRNRNRISQKDVLFAEDSETGKNGVMVFKVSGDDANYRRTLGLRSRHPRLKTYSKQRQSM